MTVVLTLLACFIPVILLNAMFSGYETGMIQSKAIRIRHMAQDEKNEQAAHLLEIMRRPESLLTMLLVGNNLTLIIGTFIVTTLVTLAAGSPGSAYTDALATLILTPLFLVFGEVVPKRVFRAHPTRLTLYLLPMMRFFHGLFLPIVWPITTISRGILRVLGSRSHPMSPFMFTLEDMRSLIDESAHHGSIEPEEQEMIHSVMGLNTRLAKEIMIPRIDMQAVPVTATRSDVLMLFQSSGKSRIPLYEESIDNVIGVVHAHDVLLDDGLPDENVRHLAHEVMHVPDTMKLDDLFKGLKDAKQHMAIVTDEYGGTDGMVTMEDILEEIFGDIQDEYDQEEHQVTQVGPNAFVVDARADLEDASVAMGILLEDDDVETVGGWVMRITGRIPTQGEVFIHDRYRITILDGSIKSIEKVRLEILPESVPDDNTP